MMQPFTVSTVATCIIWQHCWEQKSDCLHHMVCVCVCVYVWLILHLTLEAVCVFVFRMVVLFDDCCHKIELRLRHIRLQVSVCSQSVLLACSSLSSCVSFTPWFVLVTVICWPRHVHWIAKLWPIAGDVAWSCLVCVSVEHNHACLISWVVSASDCGVRGPRFESRRWQLCLSRQLLRYTVLSTGCAPLLQCWGRLSLPPSMGW